MRLLKGRKDTTKAVGSEGRNNPNDNTENRPDSFLWEVAGKKQKWRMTLRFLTQASEQNKPGRCKWRGPTKNGFDLEFFKF